MFNRHNLNLEKQKSTYWEEVAKRHLTMLRESRNNIIDLQNEIHELKKGNTMDKILTNYYLSKENIYEIINAETGKFYKCNGFVNLTQAEQKANELAKTYPGSKWLIYAPIVEVQSNVPVASKKITH